MLTSKKHVEKHRSFYKQIWDALNILNTAVDVEHKHFNCIEIEQDNKLG